jgi:hypothetical protein
MNEWKGQKANSHLPFKENPGDGTVQEGYPSLIFLLTLN